MTRVRSEQASPGTVNGADAGIAMTPTPATDEVAIDRDLTRARAALGQLSAAQRRCSSSPTSVGSRMSRSPTARHCLGYGEDECARRVDQLRQVMETM